MDIGKYSHITPVLYELHWLPVHARIQCKILLLAFKVIHGLAPKYISNLLSMTPKSSYNLRSNSGILLEPSSGKMFVILGGHAFQVAALHLWNKLLLQLRVIETVEVFKQSTKTFLFKQFFSWLVVKCTNVIAFKLYYYFLTCYIYMLIIWLIDFIELIM